MELMPIYVANGIGIFLLMMLMYASRTKFQTHRPEDRLYSFMLIGVMLGCFMEAFSYYLDGKLFFGSRVLNYIANTYLFTLNILLPFSVLVYVDLGLYDDISRIWKNYKPQIIIGAVMLTITFLSCFFPIAYSISEQNVYERRPIGYLYYFVILYYLVSGIVLTKRYEKENGAKAFFNVNVFLIPILVGAGLQFLFYGLSLAWLSSAIGLVGLFMMQQNELAYIDSLVDTYNRQYLNHIFSAWTSRGNTFVGAMLDIDHFKSINDRFGHSEGDRALKKTAEILKRSRLDHEWIFRFAGDEFVVLKLSSSPDGLDAYMDAVSKNVDEYNRADHPYRLALSYGTAFFDSGDLDTFMKQMDARMYEMKAIHHRESEGLTP